MRIKGSSKHLKFEWLARGHRWKTPQQELQPSLGDTGMSHCSPIAIVPFPYCDSLFLPIPMQCFFATPSYLLKSPTTENFREINIGLENAQRKQGDTMKAALIW